MENSTVTLLVSRNKDNKHIPDFKERRWAFFSGSHDCDKFAEFILRGLPGEMCRMYVSVNERNMAMVRTELICELVRSPEFDLKKLESEAVSIAMKPGYATTHKWLFDFDSKDEGKLVEFVNDLSLATDQLPVISTTPNGYHLVVDHGFDVRLLPNKWSEVYELKRDAMMLSAWYKNNTIVRSRRNDAD